MKHCNIKASLMAVHEPLIEADILVLQQKFLQTGFHNLKFKDINSARLIIDKVLKSLNCYHDIAILSEQYNGQQYFNALKALAECDNNLTEFFLEQFYFDFIIIEKSASLDLFNKFEQFIIDFNFHKTMPIVIVSE